jgi:hypothetical protein
MSRLNSWTYCAHALAHSVFHDEPTRLHVSEPHLCFSWAHTCVSSHYNDYTQSEVKYSYCAGIAQWYGAGLRAGLIPAGAGNFSLHHRFQTGSGTHPASYQMGTRFSFPERGVKLTAHLHLLPRSRMLVTIPPLPQYIFMARCWVKAQGKSWVMCYVSEI